MLRQAHRSSPRVAARMLLAAARGRHLPAVGQPDEAAFINAPGGEAGWRRVVASGEDSRWRNRVSARWLLGAPLPPGPPRGRRCTAPGWSASARPTGWPRPGPAIAAARRAPLGELRTYPGVDHFDIYDGPEHEAVVADEVAFLRRHLLPRRLDPHLRLRRRKPLLAPRSVGHGAEVEADLAPGVAVDHLVAGAPAAARRRGRVVDRLDHRRGEGLGVVGRNQPAGLGVVDDRRRAAAVDRDHRQPAGHRLDQHLAELLVDRGVDEQVGGAQEVGQLRVGVPAGEEDVGAAEPLDRLDRVLPLPLPGVAAEQDQGGGLARSAVAPARRPRSAAAAA